LSIGKYSNTPTAFSTVGVLFRQLLEPGRLAQGLYLVGPFPG